MRQFISSVVKQASNRSLTLPVAGVALVGWAAFVGEYLKSSKTDLGSVSFFGPNCKAASANTKKETAAPVAPQAK